MRLVNQIRVYRFVALNEEQRKAVKSLERALNAAGRAGLTGGVYDRHFILWPSDNPPELDAEFFNNAEEVGALLHTPDISLDGGSGV